MKKASLVVTTLVLALMLMSTVPNSVDLSSNISDVPSQPRDVQHEDALVGRGTIKSRIEASAEGDRNFTSLTQLASIEGGVNETQMDIWAEDDSDLLANGTNWLLEVWINETGTNDNLHIQAHRFDGTSILSTPSYYLLDNCLNASVWASDANGVWEIAVAGTWTTPGQPSGFLYSLSFTGIGVFAVNDLEDELQGLANLSITDMKQDHVDSDGWEEIVLCGFAGNSTSHRYDGIVIVWNSTGVALDPSAEHVARWWNESADIKNTALDIGDLRGDGLPDLCVTGWTDNSGDATAYASIHYFRGEDYSPNDGDWSEPYHTFHATTTSHGYDIVIGDVDQDSTNETHTVGEIAANALYLVVVQNWSATLPVTESFAAPTADASDNSAAYEVEIVPAREWDTAPLLAMGVVGYTIGEGDYMFTYIVTYDGSSFGTESQIRTQSFYDRIDNYCEIRIADVDGDGDSEFWLCFSAETTTRLRNDTVWGASYDVEGPPGSWHPPRDDVVRPAHTPTPGEADDTPPWEAPVTVSLLETWGWPSIWLALSSVLLAGLLVLYDREMPKSMITVGGLIAAIVLLGLVAGAVLLAPSWISITSQSGWESFLGVFGGVG